MAMALFWFPVLNAIIVINTNSKSSQVFYQRQVRQEYMDLHGEENCHGSFDAQNMSILMWPILI